MELNVLKKVNARYSKREITKELYQQKKEELAPDEFAKKYTKTYFCSGSDDFVYFEKGIVNTHEELQLLVAYDQLVVQEETNRHLKVLKSCIIFFTALVVIGILAMLIMMFKMADGLSLLGSL